MLAVLCCVTSSAVGAGLVRLAGHVPPALVDAVRLPDPVAPKATTGDIDLLALTVVFNRDDEEGFQQYLQDVYDPASAIFRRFMTPVEIADAFGPSQDAYDRTLEWMRANGLELAEGAPNRMTAIVRGRRADVERAFLVALHDYRIGTRKFRAADNDPALPAELAPHVHAIVGLSDLAQPQPIVNYIPNNQAGQALWWALCFNEALNGGDSVFTGFPPVFFKLVFGEVLVTLSLINALVNIAQASDLSSEGTGAKFAKCVNIYNKKYGYSLIGGGDPPPPAWQGADGTGQTVGLLQFDTFLMSDVADYIALMGQAAGSIANVSQVHVAGGVAAPGPNEDEVLLDIANVLTAAPGAHIKVFDAPFTGVGSFQGMFNAMINGGVTIISNSWAYCENQTTIADVTSLDSVLQTAAGAGISVFTGSGDRGSTCLNGSPNVAHVPATSPHITAVGGSSMQVYPGMTYGTETWWDGSADTPPGGQGGFGTSQFFSRPSYQNGLTAATMRSIPDVVAAADPKDGVMICQASAGGCPTGARYGGTSSSAPMWAGFAALLNQTQGTNLGWLNPQIYPYANTGAFHNAQSMQSDFAHVGLGSPNLARLHLKLTNQTVGAVSPTVSSVRAYTQTTLTLSPGATLPLPALADGVNQTFIVVTLADANGNPVGGKSITPSTTAASNAQFKPASVVTDADTGVAIFFVTDTTTETITVQTTDTTDGIVLPEKPKIQFFTPPAAGGSAVAFTGSALADGVDSDTITVTLQDSLNRPTPGKRVRLSQNGSSVIVGPASGVTDATGKIVFTVTDTKQETVTYTAIDETDGSLSLPQQPTVAFSAGGGDNCGINNLGNPNVFAAEGYRMTPYATGFLPKISNYGGLTNGCRGASGLAFDGAGNLFVSDMHAGTVYKFPPGGGVAGAGTLLPNSTTIGPGLESLAFDHTGRLYGAIGATTGNFFTGAVLEISPASGSVVRTVASSITCASFLATDPLSGDLFVDDSCSGSGSDNGSIWRISNPSAPAPSTAAYATTPGTNGGLAFAPGGSLYVLDYPENGVARVTGTNKPQPATYAIVPGIQSPVLDVLVTGNQGNGDGTVLLKGHVADANLPAGLRAWDLTTNPATLLGQIVNNGFGNVDIVGPDNCVYASMSVAVYRITNADGSCPLNVGGATLTLTPGMAAPNPVQGSTQTMTGQFHFTTVAAGTPVTFAVSGANTLERLVRTDATGKATFSYKGMNAGTDTVVATARVGGVNLASNSATVTWSAGVHSTTFDINDNPSGGTVGVSVQLKATLYDATTAAFTPVGNAPVVLSIGAQSCNATTNASGVATCSVAPSTAGSSTLGAAYAGSAQFAPASATRSFVVVAPIGLDVDGNGQYDALTDGLMIIRWMFGLTGASITNNAIGLNATRTSPAEVTAYLEALRSVLDIDANGSVDALTDGLMILRYLFGLRGASVTVNAIGPNATRALTPDIETYIQSLMPPIN